MRRHDNSILKICNPAVRPERRAGPTEQVQVVRNLLCRFSTQWYRREGESRSRLRVTRYTQAMSSADDPTQPPRRTPRCGGGTWPSHDPSTRLASGAKAGCSASSTPASSSWPAPSRAGLHRPRGRGPLRAVAAQLLPVLRRQARVAAGALRRGDPLDGRAPRGAAGQGAHAARATAPLRRRVLPHVPARAEGPGVEEQPDAGPGGVLPSAADRAPGRRRRGPSCRWSRCWRRSLADAVEAGDVRPACDR